MPALDQCHPKVVRALQKAGWAVDNKPATLSAQERTVFIDIRARRLTNGITQQILLAEVKCFADKNSRTTDLYTTIGQYLVYRTLLEEAEVIIPL